VGLNKDNISPGFYFMIKIIITALIWIACFLVLLPSDKPTWMGVVAGLASYQVMMYFVNEIYDVLLDILGILNKLLPPIEKGKTDDSWKNQN